MTLEERKQIERQVRDEKYAASLAESKRNVMWCNVGLAALTVIAVVMAITVGYGGAR